MILCFEIQFFLIFANEKSQVFLIKTEFFER